jgi:hypothetical protein
MIKVLDKSHLDLATPIGRGFIAFPSALAGGTNASGSSSLPTKAELLPASVGCTRVASPS